MRQWLSFDVEGTNCVATIDAPSGENHHPNGLLIVSGGNEIRSGAHRGMARLAAEMAKNGVLPINGSHNFRDMGGYAAADGRYRVNPFDRRDARDC